MLKWWFKTRQFRESRILRLRTHGLRRANGLTYQESPNCGRSSSYRQLGSAIPSNICPPGSCRRRMSPPPGPTRRQSYLVDSIPTSLRSRTRPSKTRKLSPHVSLDLKPSPETLSCGTAVNSILRIHRGDQCDVPGF